MPTIEERIKSGIQYRDMQLRAADQAASMIVEGYATTYNQPYLLWGDGEEELWEEIDARACDHADMSDVIFQVNHEGRVFARTRNDTLTIGSDAVGLHTLADLTNSDGGPGVYSDIKGGYLDRMSWAFTVKNDKWESYTQTRDGKEIRVHKRTILEVGKVYDVSVVSIPANDFTSISARSLVDGMRAKEAAEAAAAVKRSSQIHKIKILLEV